MQKHAAQKPHRISTHIISFKDNNCELQGKLSLERTNEFCDTSEHPVPAVEPRVKQAGRKVTVIAPVFLQSCCYMLLHGKSFYLQVTVHKSGSNCSSPQI